MNTLPYTESDIAELNRRGRETVSRVENDEHRRAEDTARAERLRQDFLVYVALETLKQIITRLPKHERRAVIQQMTLGRCSSLLEIEEAQDRYSYLLAVPESAFSAVRP